MIFELPLTEERVKPHQVTALHLMAAFAFIGSGMIFHFAYAPAKVWGLALAIGGLLLLLLTIFRNKWLISRSVNRIFRIAELMIMLSLASLAGMHKWTPPAVMFGVLSAAVLFALYWEQTAQSALFVYIDEQGVKLPVTSRRRFISWMDIDQVLIRFGTLTVNCADNRLYQHTIGKADIDMDIFNAFCDKYIAEGKEKRDKNDW